MPRDNRRQRTRTAVEGRLRLDASELAWGGVLDGAASVDEWPLADLAESAVSLFERGWIRQPVRIASYEVRAGEGRSLVVSLTLETASGSGAIWSTYHTVRLEPTSARFGGVRWWFICGRCAKRRAHLYSDGGPWVCRECHCLTYLSRQRRNWASYRGSGWMALSRAWDVNDAQCNGIARRNLRRRLGRWRTRTRHVEAVQQLVPLQLGLCAPPPDTHQ